MEETIGVFAPSRSSLLYKYEFKAARRRKSGISRLWNRTLGMHDCYASSTATDTYKASEVVELIYAHVSIPNHTKHDTCPSLVPSFKHYLFEISKARPGCFVHNIPITTINLSRPSLPAFPFPPLSPPPSYPHNASSNTMVELFQPQL